MSFALLVQDPAVPPVVERPFGDPVEPGPGDITLPHLRVAQDLADLRVAQDGDAIVRPGVPGLLACIVHLVRGDAEVGVGDVEVGHLEGFGGHVRDFLSQRFRR